MIRALGVIAVIGLLSGCPSIDPGILVGGLDNTEFVAVDPTRLVVTQSHSTYERTHEIRTLRGERVRTIGTGSFGIVDIDDEGERFVGQAYSATAAPALFAGAVSGSMRPLPEPDKWFGAAIDPLGTRIAVTDPARELIDVFSFDDLQTSREIACPENAFCYWVSWDNVNPDVLWVAGRGPGNNYARIDLKTGHSANFPPDAFPNVRRANMMPGSLHSDRCWTSDAALIPSNEGIALRAGDSVRELVTIEDFHHPRVPAITFASFIAHCRYVLFGYDDSSWLADVESGQIGRLEGDVALVLP